MEKEYKFQYERYDDLGALPPSDQELITRARNACINSYSPYSDFRVGAAAILASGRIIESSNQESSVFPAGICAEHGLLAMWQAHYSEDPIKVMAIVSVPGNKECYPCGICRQVLCDTEKRQGSSVRIIMASDKSATIVPSATCLMPFTFKL